MKFCKLRVKILKATFASKIFFPATLRSSFVSESSCGSYTASYIGKTYRHFQVRVSKCQSVCSRTSKPVKATLSTVVRDHVLICDRKVVHEDFNFLVNESNRYLLELKGSLFNKRDKPSFD